METNLPDKSGYVYVLTSPNAPSIKIGGTGLHPMKRVREVNRVEPYKSMGPWTLTDFRQVSHWRDVEYRLHYVFRDRFVRNIDGQSELFSVSPAEASAQLEAIQPEEIIGKPKVDRLFANDAFRSFLVQIFRYSGLCRWINEQGIWTLTLFPSTAGGRFFTLNIGLHEVAYSTLPRKDCEQINMIYMDKLILDFPLTMTWIVEHGGGIDEDTYASALEHGVSIYIPGALETVNEFLTQRGVRRAILAYWSESLITRTEDDRMSMFARHHAYNAVAALQREINTLIQ